MKKLILFILTVAVLILVSNNYEQNYYIIPEESIRIRIIPNSNNIKDQYIKNQVKANIELELQEDLKRVTTIDESRRVIKNNINKYDDVIETVLNNEKYLKKHTIDYGYHYFPEKIYKGVKYSEGKYESLLITLGEAKGDNWWCVLFPPICSLEEDESGQKIEYSFLVKEMFNKYLK